MSNTLDTATAKQLALTVIFTWGNPGATFNLAYIRWDSDVSGSVGDFTSCPELMVETEKQHGGVADVPYFVTIRDTRQPIANLCRPYAHATVTVTIGELDPADPDGTYREHFQGKISITERNVNGLQHLVKATVVGWKEGAGYPLGVFCNSSCAHIFADVGCAITLLDKKQTVTVSNITKNVITCTGVDMTGLPDNYFSFGEAGFEGLSLMITAQLDATRFQLSKRPPPEWLGSDIGIYPGCDKQYDGDCGTKWNNRKRFLGLGIFMPSHNPQTEPG